MQTVRGSDSIDIRNSPQANNSNAVQSEEKAKKAEDQPTKPDHNAHHAPDHGYASSERGFGQPKHHAAGPGPNRQAGRKPNAEKPKAARSPIEQEPSVSVRLKGGASQSEGYSVSSYGTARPDRRSVNRWGREKCIGCMEKLTRNPFRFTKACCSDWLKRWWWVAVIVVILFVGIIVGTVIALLPAAYTF